MDSNGLYHLIPVEMGSPRLHPQTFVSLLIFQQRQSEGAKSYFFLVISITFHIGNLFCHQLSVMSLYASESSL